MRSTNRDSSRVSRRQPHLKGLEDHLSIRSRPDHFPVWRARVDPRGGRLAALECNSRADSAEGGWIAVIDGYEDGELPERAEGAVLFPWPNRVAGARWWWRGRTMTLPINEPALGHANHGLVMDRLFDVTAAGVSEVTVRVAVTPVAGYPFHVGLSITYALTESGLTVTSVITNDGVEPAPVALGFHPYLRAGRGPSTRWRVRVEGSEVIEFDDRLLPRRPVARQEWDVSSASRLGGEQRIGSGDLNVCLVGRGPRSHRPVARLMGEQRVCLWADPQFDFTQVYLAPEVSGRRALAVEPMTAAPDAFNSGHGVLLLASGETWRLQWGIGAAEL